MTSLAELQASIGPDQLARIAWRAASSPAMWSSSVEYRADHRWYRRLTWSQDHEVWLLSWLPGQRTGFHDHGISAGAFAVAQGCLSERSAIGGEPAASSRTLEVGAVRSFGQGYVHDVGNEWNAPAVSIHAYSPPLSRMRRFGFADDGLLRVMAEERTW
jgi:predicted metal-dependent enzyme (double-stranded beta helix superfamily)